MEYKDRVVIGLTHQLTLVGRGDKKKKIIAKIDTGATKSSIDTKLATDLQLGPVTRTKLVKSAHGNRLRPIIEAEVKLNGENIKEEFTLADRSHMKYKVLIGQNILKHGFLIDPTKK